MWLSTIRYFPKCTLIIIKSIEEMSDIAFYVLFWTRTTIKNFTDIVLITSSIFTSMVSAMYWPGIFGNVYPYRSTSKFFSVLCYYQEIFRVPAFHQPIKESPETSMKLNLSIIDDVPALVPTLPIGLSMEQNKNFK